MYISSISVVILTVILLDSYLCQDLAKIFENINEEQVRFNSIAASLAWESSLSPGNPQLPVRAAKFQKKQIDWQQGVCDKLIALNNARVLNKTQWRQTYLLCRGPKFTFTEAREVSSLYEELQSIYSNAGICIPNAKYVGAKTLTKAENIIGEIIKLENNTAPGKFTGRSEGKTTDVLCLKEEEEFEKLMTMSRNEEVLRWLWKEWRELVGLRMRGPYEALVAIENQAALRNGYTNIGVIWRDELEIPNLRQLCRRLYKDIKPLYTLLHGVTRYYLKRHYGDVVPERGPIPAHLLGNLWAQNWEPLVDLIAEPNLNLDESIKKLNWTVLHMAKRAEDFYQSLGLPAMTEAFWRESVFGREKNRAARCHGTAADMFQDGDFRLLYCAGTTADDLYVLHHEMGHIQYYMAYEHQPGIFRQANTALHETIGDAIMYGVLTPQHLHRLGLINDSTLYHPTESDEDYNLDDEDINYSSNKSNFTGFNTYKRNVVDYKKSNDIYVKANEKRSMVDKIKMSPDEILMLRQALNKLPQIPFSLLMDEYRWKYFEGKLEGTVNMEFWKMSLELQGIAPIEERGEEYFDVGAKFHVPDNTPFIRYFLSSFLQHQLFESLCKAAVFGRRDDTYELPPTISMNRCDIYGSKAAGKLLKDFMSRGHSQHWREILVATTGKDDISATALMRYYRPLYKLLSRIVHKHRIPIGWRETNQRDSTWFS